MRVREIGRLISKLNRPCHQALENAVGLCVSRTNYSVEIEHWLQKLIESPGLDISLVFDEFEIESSRTLAALTAKLDRLKRGNADQPPLGERLIHLIQQAWTIASVDYGCHSIASGHILYALFADDVFRGLIELAEFDKIDPRKLHENLPDIAEGSFESDAEELVDSQVGRKDAELPSDGSSLSQFTIDLTQQARDGKIDPVVCRDAEIRQIMDILLRRRQNNPILTGEAGVGKTAVVEGFALRIAKGDVPEPLKNAALLSLDLGALQAGAGVKGEFERRLKSVIDEVKASPSPIVLFIDEAHNLVGAGGSAGQGDAANLIKPALARGELRTIAATTWSEYKEYFEKDAALVRRFQVVKVNEPDEESAIRMMQGIVPTLEEHHGVSIKSSAVETAVKLSSRYITGRQLPDKSVSVLDTSCARITLSQSSMPAQVEDAHRRVDSLELELEILEREAKTGVDNEGRRNEAQQELEASKLRVATIEQRWNKEQEFCQQILELREQLVSGEDLADRDQIMQQLKELESGLAELQGEHPLVHTEVSSEAIAETVGAWTGIPVGKMLSDEINTVLNLKELLEESVVGQSHAMELIARSIQTSRANLVDPQKPVGVFLLAGTSGVGKTETALTLANLLYGGEQNMTTIDMSQLTDEEMAQTKLFGSTAGYVGYGEGGLLTEAVRRKPYSVVLLDEFEKAAGGIQLQFYQIFDAGRAQDGQGIDVDFRNTIILLTTNAGAEFIKNLCADPETRPDPEAFAKAIFPELLKAGFEPAFLGRISIVPYYPLEDEVMKRIIRLKLKKIGKRIGEHHSADFEATERLIDAVADRCTEVDTGARNIDHIFNRTMLPELSTRFLSSMAEGSQFQKVVVDADDDGAFKYELS